MTKIYEALQRAESERSDQPRKKVESAPASIATHPAMEEKLIALNHQIEARLEHVEGGRVVQFAGVRRSDHASRLAYEFAKLAAFRLNKKVLLMAAGPFPHIRGVFSGEGPDHWEELIKDGVLAGEVVHPVEEEGTALSLVKASQLALPTLLASPQSRSSFQDLRERFDLVLIDAPPLPQSFNAAMMASLADGVVLVLESERVRWPVVRHCIDQIESQKGRALGLVINGKRYYIPQSIYRVLFHV